MDIGPGWTVYDGAHFIVSSGAAVCNAQSIYNQAHATSDAMHANYTASCTYNDGGFGFDGGLVIRYDPATVSHFLFTAVPGVGTQLYLITSGTPVLLATGVFSVISGVTYSLSVVAAGTTLTCRINGDVGSQISDSSGVNAAATLVGIEQDSGLGAMCGSFLVVP
jgi:hypothetical protein